MNDVQVVNGNRMRLKGRFAAKDYVFEPNVPTAVPLAAAEHIFGWNDKDKTGALNRLGLLTPGNGSTYDSAMRALDRVTFHQGRVVFEGGKPGKPGIGQPKHPQTQDPAEPSEEPERAPGVPGHQQPGPQPGTQHPGTHQPGKQGPGEHEQFEDNDDEEKPDKGIGGRPGAARDPGGKPEAEENPTPSSASGDLDSYLATLVAAPGRSRKVR